MKVISVRAPFCDVVANLIFWNTSRDACDSNMIKFPILKWQAVYEKIPMDEAYTVRESPMSRGGIAARAVGVTVPGCTPLGEAETPTWGDCAVCSGSLFEHREIGNLRNEVETHKSRLWPDASGADDPRA